MSTKFYDTPLSAPSVWVKLSDSLLKNRVTWKCHYVTSEMWSWEVLMLLACSLWDHFFTTISWGTHDELSPPVNSDTSEFRNRSSGPSQAFRLLQPWPKSRFHLLYGKSIYLAALGLSCPTGLFRCGRASFPSGIRAGFLVVAHGLRCCVACGVSVLWPEIELTSPALEGGFITTPQEFPRAWF